MKSITNLLSWFLLPLTMPLLALSITMYLPTDLDFSTISNAHYYLHDNAKKLLLNTFFLFIWIFPTLSVLLMRLSQQNASIDPLSPRLRRNALILTVVYLLMLWFVLIRFNQQMTLSIHLFALIFSGIGLTIILLLLHTFLGIFISLHACGIGVFFGFIFAYYGEQSLGNAWWLYACCCLAGVFLSTRLFHKKNTPSEIYWGMLIGFLVIFVIDKFLIHYLSS